MKLSDVYACLKKDKPEGFLEKEICGITHDSRNVKAGYVFVAIRGHKLDGHDFVGKAVVEGAIALVVEEKIKVVPHSTPQIVVSNTRKALALVSSNFYSNPSSQMTIVGITGTDGKTTTSYLIRSILNTAGCNAGLIGTIQHYIGNRVLPARETTPESIEIQQHLAEMLKSGIKYVVLEASSHALFQHRLDEINFAVAVFTNLSAEHLDYHKNMKSYREEKIKLVKGLGFNDFSILNADHDASKHFAESSKSQILWYGIKRKTADVTAEMIEIDEFKTKFTLNSPWGKETIHLHLLGRHNIYNALAAATTGFALGIKIDMIKKGIESLQEVPGRLEKVNYGQDFHIYIDFAHTHQALRVILRTLREIAKRRVIVVFGCGGDRDRKKRAKMGHIAEKYADIFWVTSDNPRTEDPNKIIEEILQGVTSEACFRVQPNRKAAIEEALLEANKGDIVLIAGKGHERYQTFQQTTIPFDEREIIRQALKITTICA
ncbi:MAG: UDP-N-acetylmuramoyl-L-alanyl-D-glutamate--2,6-diaminopimelate ligase [Candidatus Brocadiaceae bacterium]|nr:UDP-N-acetylmuramoyl-L-alanyl-D-glutamate--2,6-diaminopimelate ligase [Candidatus Brocadiaceae bacterium]